MNTMKKIICLVIVLALSSCMVLTAAADSEAEFVPSVTYKGLLVSEAELDGEDVLQCVAVTNVKEAREKSTDITQEARDLLIEVYEELEKGSMKLPVEEGYIVRELVDVSFMQEACVEVEDHNNKSDILAEDGTLIKITFELGVAKDADVVIMAYVGEEWVEAVEIVNNGDGSVTASFEDICPVAICVK